MRKVVIVTPLYGHPEAASVSWGYYMSVSQLLRDPNVTFIDGRLVMNCDLVRARSRAVRQALESNATDVLFWDEDVVPRDLRVLAAMIQSEKDVIGLPYPRKQMDWEKCAEQVRDENETEIHGRMSAAELEGAALDWPIRTAEATIVNGIAKVNDIGLGFCLIRRHVLEQMCQKYGPELMFQDLLGGIRYPTVAIFQLMIRDGLLLSEDYSFCQRWRDMGGEIHVMVDPAQHVGRYAFGKALK